MALSQLIAVLGQEHGWFEITGQHHGHCKAWNEYGLTNWCHGDVFLSVLPKDQPNGTGQPVSEGEVLWASVVSCAQLEALRAFRPRPSLVFCEGATCRHTALWWLEGPVPTSVLEKANRRLAARLGTARASCEATFAFRPPGSWVQQKARRVEVRTVYDHPARYRVDDVVARCPVLELSHT